MGFARRRLARMDSGESMAELPFVLRLGGRLVPGRIDAVYEAPEGLEIVDFKTGAVPAGRDEGALDQLLLYAAALRRLGVATDGPLTLTYCYLASGTTESRTISPGAVDAALAELESGLASLEPVSD